MHDLDGITAELMAEGAPFEVVSTTVNDVTQRVFKNAPTHLVEMFDRARSHGPLEFIVHSQTRLTYDAFFEQADRLAGWLQQRAAVEPGQSVAIVMKNSPSWLVAFVAIVKCGGVAVLVNSRGTGENIKAALEDTECVLALCDGRRCDTIRASGLDISLIVSEPWTGETDFSTAIASGLSAAEVEIVTDDPACMFFTSGTTGRAKAAVLSHRNLVTGTMNTQLAMTEAFTKIARSYNITIEQLKEHIPQTCNLLVFPLFHTSGCSAIFLTGLASGSKLVLMDRWSGEEAVRIMAQEKVTAFGGVPAMHWDVLNAPNIDAVDLSSVTSMSCGGQAFPLNLIEAIRAKFPNVILGMGYGMTETSGAVSQANGDVFIQKPASSGQILPMVSVRIVSSEGQECSIGEAGEIYVKGATVMLGYYGRAEETAASFSDGWFKTGDVGVLDSDGFLTIVDRKTDMVISGGENIYCAEVEQMLSKHPLVKSVVAFGVADERLGEKLVACIEPGSGRLTETELAQFAATVLADYKVPKAFFLAPEGFERNVMGKIEKHKLRLKYGA